MKAAIPTLLALATLGATETSTAALVAYWNFNGLVIATAGAPGTGTVPTSIDADLGSGTVGLSTWGGTVDDFTGSTLNVIAPDASGASLSLVASGPTGGPYPGNDTFITISFSMAGFEDPVVTFDTRGTSTGFDNSLWSWSTNGVDFTPVAGVSTATRTTSFATAMVDLSDVDELDGAPTVVLRYALSGATSGSGNNRIDNLQVNAIPEPSVALLGALGALGLLRRRRP
jgi:hypothetical protein